MGGSHEFRFQKIIAGVAVGMRIAGISGHWNCSCTDARQRAIDASIAELNGRETLSWSNEKISLSGWISDAKTFGFVDPFLGAEYEWATDDPDRSGGTLTFKKSALVSLSRAESTHVQPGSWSR